MPRYFLNIQDRKIGTIIDLEGEDAADLDAVRRIAEETIRDIIARPQVYGAKRIWRHRAIEIVDEAGTILLTVPFLSSGDAP